MISIISKLKKKLKQHDIKLGVKNLQKAKSESKKFKIKILKAKKALTIKNARKSVKDLLRSDIDSYSFWVEHWEHKIALEMKFLKQNRAILNKIK